MKLEFERVDLLLSASHKAFFSIPFVIIYPSLNKGTIYTILLSETFVSAFSVQILSYKLSFKLKTILCHNKTDLL